MMPGSKGLNPHELAHKWMKGLLIRPNIYKLLPLYIVARYIGYLHSISALDICQAFSVDMCKEAAVFTTAPELPYASDA